MLHLEASNDFLLKQQELNSDQKAQMDLRLLFAFQSNLATQYPDH